MDFSQSSLVALRCARELGTHFGAALTVVHVNQPMSAVSEYGSVPLSPPVDLSERARMELRKLASREFPDATNVSTQLRTGAAYDQIVTAARKSKADLIVLSTHGRTGLSRAVLGSTAERVVRHAPCPVLVVPARERRRKA